ncbi:MAG TPA: hypothetical protein VGD64_09900 [Acidisarcina sp.]
MTGFWKFSLPYGGTSYLELKQRGEVVTSVGRGGPRRAITGTLHNGKLHLEGAVGRPGSKPPVFDGVVGDVVFR